MNHASNKLGCGRLVHVNTQVQRYRVKSTMALTSPTDLRSDLFVAATSFLLARVWVREVAMIERSHPFSTSSAMNRGVSGRKREAERIRHLHWSTPQSREEYMSQEATRAAP